MTLDAVTANVDEIPQFLAGLATATGKPQGCSLTAWPPREGRSSGGPSGTLLFVCKPCLATSR